MAKGMQCRLFLAKRPMLRRYVGIIKHDPCVWCGSDGGTVEHIVPRKLWDRLVHGEWHRTTRTGVHFWNNVAMACRRCNSQRGAQGLLMYLVQRHEGNADRPS